MLLRLSFERDARDERRRLRRFDRRVIRMRLPSVRAVGHAEMTLDVCPRTHSQYHDDRSDDIADL